MFDGDPQARAKDRDRDRATYVVDAALRNGQISQQDRDLRAERIGSAATVGELAALTRDIAAPPAPVTSTAMVPPAVVVTTVPADPYAPGSTRPVAGVPSDLYGPAPKAKKAPVATGTGLTTKPSQTGRKVAIGCALIVGLFFIVPIAAGVIIFATTQHNDFGSDFGDPDPIPAGPPFVLNGPGIREYVASFDSTFDETQVVRTVFYDSYVLSWVPQGDQVALWNYSDGEFEVLGSPMDDTEDTAPVDLADLKPAKVMSLVRQATSTLGVEDPTSTYVIYDRAIFSGDPQVMVYLTNDDGQSGYLIGDLEGKVLQTSTASPTVASQQDFLREIIRRR